MLNPPAAPQLQAFLVFLGETSAPIGYFKEHLKSEGDLEFHLKSSLLATDALLTIHCTGRNELNKLGIFDEEKKKKSSKSGQMKWKYAFEQATIAVNYASYCTWQTVRNKHSFLKASCF